MPSIKKKQSTELLKHIEQYKKLLQKERKKLSTKKDESSPASRRHAIPVNDQQTWITDTLAGLGALEDSLKSKKGKKGGSNNPPLSLFLSTYRNQNTSAQGGAQSSVTKPINSLLSSPKVFGEDIGERSRALRRHLEAYAVYSLFWEVGVGKEAAQNTYGKKALWELAEKLAEIGDRFALSGFSFSATPGTLTLDNLLGEIADLNIGEKEPAKKFLEQFVDFLQTPGKKGRKLETFLLGALGNKVEEGTRNKLRMKLSQVSSVPTAEKASANKALDHNAAREQRLSSVPTAEKASANKALDHNAARKQRLAIQREQKALIESLERIEKQFHIVEAAVKKGVDARRKAGSAISAHRHAEGERHSLEKSESALKAQVGAKQAQVVVAKKKSLKKRKLEAQEAFKSRQKNLVQLADDQEKYNQDNFVRLNTAAEETLNFSKSFYGRVPFGEMKLSGWVELEEQGAFSLGEDNKLHWNSQVSTAFSVMQQAFIDDLKLNLAQYNTSNFPKFLRGRKQSALFRELAVLLEAQNPADSHIDFLKALEKILDKHLEGISPVGWFGESALVAIAQDARCICKNLQFMRDKIQEIEAGDRNLAEIGSVEEKLDALQQTPGGPSGEKSGEQSSRRALSVEEIAQSAVKSRIGKEESNDAVKEGWKNYSFQELLQHFTDQVKKIQGLVVMENVEEFSPMVSALYFRWKNLGDNDKKKALEGMDLPALEEADLALRFAMVAVKEQRSVSDDKKKKSELEGVQKQLSKLHKAVSKKLDNELKEQLKDAKKVAEEEQRELDAITETNKKIMGLVKQIQEKGLKFVGGVPSEEGVIAIKHALQFCLNGLILEDGTNRLSENVSVNLTNIQQNLTKLFEHFKQQEQNANKVVQQYSDATTILDREIGEIQRRIESLERQEKALDNAVLLSTQEVIKLVSNSDVYAQANRVPGRDTTSTLLATLQSNANTLETTKRELESKQSLEYISTAEKVQVQRKLLRENSSSQKKQFPSPQNGGNEKASSQSSMGAGKK